MQPSNDMGTLVRNLWDHYGEDGHFNGYRLALHHPNHGILITQDIEFFMVRHVVLVPEADLERLAAGASPLPSVEMLFHINEHEIWHPFQISSSLSNVDPLTSPVPALPSDLTSQEALAEFSDQWAAMLQTQQWMTQASKVPSALAAEIPTHQQWQPDGATVDQWLATDPNMEAFDGCKIVHSSVCEHGFQSWAKEMGYTP